MQLPTGTSGRGLVDSVAVEPPATGNTPPVTPAGGASTADILDLRKELMRLARLQLQRDASLADDVVQETLLAAIQSLAQFRGESSLKTWLVGILKFKVLDALRARARQPVSLTELEPELHTDDLDALFDTTGTWCTKPQDWSDPDFASRQRDFLQLLERCLTELPKHTARAFMLRELFEVETDEICRLLAITPNHMGVLLYRARMTLRRCVEGQWLDLAEATP